MVLGTLVIMSSALVGGHVYSALFYYPERVAEDPTTLLKLLHSQALFGALLAGSLSGIIYLHLRRVPKLLYAEPYVFGTLAFMTIGRLGCAITHNHPGTISTFWGAVKGWPDGAIRHDLGLYELIFMVLLTGTMYALRNRHRGFPGFHVVVPMLAYGVVRFGLDFLRTMDARYAGLTPGHYGSMVLFAAGALLLIYGFIVASKPRPSAHGVSGNARQDGAGEGW